MIIVFKPKTSEEDVRKVASVVEAKGLTTHIVVGGGCNNLWCYWRYNKSGS